MSYDLFALPVPGGADIEEAGEALLARLQAGHEPAFATDEAAAARRAIATALLRADATLDAAGPAAGEPLCDVLAAPDGLQITVAERHVRFHVPFAAAGEEADALFERLFVLVAVLATGRGWRVYDPQAACGVAPDDAGRASTLEIYLSVMDQLDPGAAD